jgi:hypothetical protein
VLPDKCRSVVRPQCSAARLRVMRTSLVTECGGSASGVQRLATKSHGDEPLPQTIRASDERRDECPSVSDICRELPVGSETGSLLAAEIFICQE